MWTAESCKNIAYSEQPFFRLLRLLVFDCISAGSGENLINVALPPIGLGGIQ